MNLPSIRAELSETLKQSGGTCSAIKYGGTCSAIKYGGKKSRKHSKRSHKNRARKSRKTRGRK